MKYLDSYFKVFLAGLAVSAVLLGVFMLLREPVAEKPYLKILGGGFVFNYRIAEVFAGFTAVPVKPIPIGSRLLARFENPSGGEAILVEHSMGLPDRRLMIRSPALKGVKAQQAYGIEIELYESQAVKPFWRTSLTIRSQIGQEDVPDRPLTIGPGYHQPDLVKSSE